MIVAQRTALLHKYQITNPRHPLLSIFIYQNLKLLISGASKPTPLVTCWKFDEYVGNFVGLSILQAFNRWGYGDKAL